MVSVIVPTREEAAALPGLLDHLHALPGRFEVLVVDGGSGDATTSLARAHPLRPRVLEARGGRGDQLNAGAALASGELLLSLHADSRLPPLAYTSLSAATEDGAVVGGNFALRFAEGGWFARTLSAIYRVQPRIGVYYGDSSVCRRSPAPPMRSPRSRALAIASRWSPTAPATPRTRRSIPPAWTATSRR